MADALRAVIAKRAISVHFQPIVDTRERSLLGHVAAETGEMTVVALAPSYPPTLSVS